MALAPALSRRVRNRLVFMPESAAIWYHIARLLRAQIKAENVWRQPRSIPFCHMPISQADYLTRDIDTGRLANVAGTLDI
jgi:hypothetical protein